jgi:hypothetical protein
MQVEPSAVPEYNAGMVAGPIRLTRQKQALTILVIFQIDVNNVSPKTAQVSNDLEHCRNIKGVLQNGDLPITHMFYFPLI